MGSEVPIRYPLDSAKAALLSTGPDGRAAIVRPSIRGRFTLTVLIPRFYNPGEEGVRRPVEPKKIRETEQEMLEWFGGYQRFLIQGGYRDPVTGEDFFDESIRFDIDAEIDHDDHAFLDEWRETLAERFRQRAIYMKLVPLT